MTKFALTGFIVAKYFSLKIASFSALLRYCMAIVRLISWSICIRRLERIGGGGRVWGEDKGRQIGKEREREKGREKEEGSQLSNLMNTKLFSSAK